MDGHGYVDVASAAEVPSEAPFLHVRLGTRDVLLVRDADGAVRALDRACPHLGNPLTRGCVTGRTLECPHHYYAYDLADGRNTFPGDDRDLALGVHDVREHEGRVLVRLTGPDA